MTARILKSLTLALVLGGIFAASASAMQIAEPSIYSARLSKPSAAPVVPIVSEKVAGLQAAVPAGIFSDRSGRKLETISREIPPNDLSAAIGLDLMNRPHHHARQIKGEI